MISLEMVEKLRTYGNISFQEAKEALEKTNGDILEAIVNLENEGKISKPEAGGFYSSKEGSGEVDREAESSSVSGQASSKKKTGEKGKGLRQLIRDFFAWLNKVLAWGNRNSLDVTKDGQHVFSVAVTIIAILLFVGFWFIIPLMIVGLFLGYRYSFSGPDLGKDVFNQAMDSVANAAETLKKEVKGEQSDGEDSSN